MAAVKSEGQYILKKVFESPESVIRVFSPVISEEEREKRMQSIHKAAAKLLAATK